MEWEGFEWNTKKIQKCKRNQSQIFPFQKNLVPSEWPTLHERHHLLSKTTSTTTATTTSTTTTVSTTSIATATAVFLLLDKSKKRNNKIQLPFFCCYETEISDEKFQPIFERNFLRPEIKIVSITSLSFKKVWQNIRSEFVQVFVVIGHPEIENSRPCSTRNRNRARVHRSCNNQTHQTWEEKNSGGWRYRRFPGTRDESKFEIRK